MGTINDSITVMPVKKAVKERKRVSDCLLIKQANVYIMNIKKNNKARVRLLEALMKKAVLDYSDVIDKLKVSEVPFRD